MKIKQRSAEEISPVRNFSEFREILSQQGESLHSHRGCSFNRFSSSSFVNNYTAGVSNGNISVDFESSPNSLDLTDWPILKRSLGVNGIVRASFTNGRATSETWGFDFSTYSGVQNDSLPHLALNGSLLKYTSDTVDVIASSMTSNSMWTSSGNRDQISVIPHSFLTGHVWDGKWGGVGGAGVAPNSGRRFMAISPRHVYGCGHYQYNVGDVLRWKDVNNNIVSRVVQGVVNLKTEMTSQGRGDHAPDSSIALLTESLPSEINILPVIGDWGNGFIAESQSGFTVCKQIAGFTLLNNDGHLNPFLIADTADTLINSNQVIYNGLDLSPRQLIGSGGLNNLSTIKNWEYGQGSKFHHLLRSGDSGSPCVIPCLGGWAYSGHISSGHHPTPGLFNQLISFIDDRCGVSTGMSVTVAASPI